MQVGDPHTERTAVASPTVQSATTLKLAGWMSMVMSRVLQLHGTYGGWVEQGNNDEPGKQATPSVTNMDMHGDTRDTSRRDDCPGGPHRTNNMFCYPL